MTRWKGGRLGLGSVGFIPVPLALVHVAVQPAQAHQLGVGAGFDDAPAVEHHDDVGSFGGSKAVGDEQGGDAGGEALEAGVELALGDWIQGGGRLIEDAQGGGAGEGAGHGDTLPFAAGDVHAIGHILAEGCGGALRQALDQRPQPGALKHLLGGGDPLGELAVGDKLVPEEDVVVQGDAVAGEILVDDGEERVQLGGGVFGDSTPVDEDIARLDRVEPGDQAGEGGFAAAIGADQGVVHAGLEGHVQAVEDEAVGAGVAEGDIAKLEQGGGTTEVVTTRGMAEATAMKRGTTEVVTTSGKGKGGRGGQVAGLFGEGEEGGEVFEEFGVGGEAVDGVHEAPDDVEFGEGLGEGEEETDGDRASLEGGEEQQHEQDPDELVGQVAGVGVDVPFDPGAEADAEGVLEDHTPHVGEHRTGAEEGTLGGGIAPEHDIAEIIEAAVVLGDLPLGAVEGFAAAHTQRQGEASDGDDQQRQPPDRRGEQGHQPTHLEDEGGHVDQVVVGGFQAPTLRVGGDALDQIPGVAVLEQAVLQAGALLGEGGTVAGAQGQHQLQVGEVVHGGFEPAEGGDAGEQDQIAVDRLDRRAVAHRADDGINQAGGDQGGYGDQGGGGELEEAVEEGGERRAAE